MAKDPVCGMGVDPAEALATVEYQGESYYFCNPGCKAMFEKEPEKYVSQSKPGRQDQDRHLGDH